MAIINVTLHQLVMRLTPIVVLKFVIQDITNPMSTQIVSNAQLGAIVHQQLKQSHVRLDITKTNVVKQHVIYVQLVLNVMVHQRVHAASQNIPSLECPTVLPVPLVTFVRMSLVTAWPLANLEHMSTTTTVKLALLGQNVRHQFKARLHVLALRIFVLMRTAKETLFVPSVQLDQDAVQPVQPAVPLGNTRWKVNETAIHVRTVIFVLQLI